ncbi:MAG: hypothetical protein HW389_776 [Bacteroidetes bacterium]|nr:hypothetical protein [Bacteroidota bacterium]
MPQIGQQVGIECASCGEYAQYIRVMLGTRQIKCFTCDAVIEVTFGQAINGEVIVNSRMVRRGIDLL